MVSENGLITIGDLELFMGSVDLETKYGYTDTTVESWMSNAENMVIGITETAWNITSVTGAIKTVILMWAKQFVLNQMIQEGHTSSKNPESKSEIYLTKITKALMGPSKKANTAERSIWVERG